MAPGGTTAVTTKMTGEAVADMKMIHIKVLRILLKMTGEAVADMKMTGETVADTKMTDEVVADMKMTTEEVAETVGDMKINPGGRCVDLICRVKLLQVVILL